MRAAYPRKPGSKVAPRKRNPHLEDRKARIERIRQAVADGTYELDPLAISRAIIRKSIKP